MILALASAVAIAAIFYTLTIRDRDIPEPIPISPVQHLLDRKQAIYDNLRDLQFEYRLGKLSDEDYQQTKLSLQRELALVLAETQELTNRLDLKTMPVNAPQLKAKAQKPAGTLCPHCGASFSQNLKFCGECGKSIA
jgi:rRNA maturation endonuclease Nob1